MTRPLDRRPGEPVEEEQGAAPLPSVPATDPILDLQRSAGNAAVARAVLARDTPYLTQPPTLVPGPNLNLMPRLAPDVEAAVDAYLDVHKAGFQREAQDGRLSLPEVVDQVRRKVPLAADASPFAIESRIALIVGSLPAKRTKRELGGQNIEYAARIANMLPKPPTSVTIGASKTSLTIRIAEAELKTSAGGVHATVKGDDEGGSAELKKGGTKVGVSGKWDGSSFGLKTEVEGVKFGGKVERKGEGWKWSGGLVFQLAGEEVDELPDISGAVSGAHSAIADSLGHLQSGGSLSDPYITGRMGQIKPAIDAAGKVAARAGKSGATLRVTASGEDGGFTAGVSLVIVF